MSEASLPPAGMSLSPSGKRVPKLSHTPWPLWSGPKTCPEESPHHSPPRRPPAPPPCRCCGAWRISGRSTRSCTEVRPTGALAGRRGWRAGPDRASPAGSAPRCEAVQHPRQLQRGDQAVRLRGERAAHRLHGQLLRGNAVLHVCKSLARRVSVTRHDPSAPRCYPEAFAKGCFLAGVLLPRSGSCRLLTQAPACLPPSARPGGRQAVSEPRLALRRFGAQPGGERSRPHRWSRGCCDTGQSAALRGPRLLVRERRGSVFRELLPGRFAPEPHWGRRRDCSGP